MAKQVVATTNKTAVGDVLPDFMKDDIGKGTEAISASSVETPRIKLIQKISPELDVHNDLRAGEFWHTILEQSLGTEVRICPIYVDERFILWRPQEDGGGILARADDGIHWHPAPAEFAVKLKDGTAVKWRTERTVAASRLDQWGSQNPANPDSPPAATRMFNMVVTFPDDPEMPPAVVTLQRSAVTVGKKFMGKLKITRAPSFGLIFKMGSTSETNKAGQGYLNYNFVGDGKVTDEAFYRANREYYELFKAQGVQIKDMESLQGEDTEAAGTTDAGSNTGGPSY